MKMKRGSWGYLSTNWTLTSRTKNSVSNWYSLKWEECQVNLVTTKTLHYWWQITATVQQVFQIDGTEWEVKTCDNLDYSFSSPHLVVLWAFVDYNDDEEEFKDILVLEIWNVESSPLPSYRIDIDEVNTSNDDGILQARFIQEANSYQILGNISLLHHEYQVSSGMMLRFKISVGGISTTLTLPS